MEYLRKLNTDIKILLGSLVVIAILSIITLLTARAPDAPALSVRNDQADGAMAFQRWLQHTGYDVQEVLSLKDQLANLDALIVLEPSVLINDSDIRMIRDWVRKGNTLIVSGSPFSINDLIQPYEVSLDFRIAETDPLAAGAPTLLNPTFDAAAVEIAYPISTEREDAVPYMFVSNNPVLMSIPEQAGQVWLSGIPLPFTNRGIQDAGNARLIANILATIPSGAAIGFDEAAHGYGEDSALDFNGWLFGTPPGWGILLAVAITLLYLALRGRRFGRAIPLKSDRLRRESGEYIQAMATLFRRSGQRSEMLAHYENQLRRRLSERFALDPKLEPKQLVQVVIYHDPSIDEAAFRDLLTRLRHDHPSEAELVKTASDVDSFLKQL
ncbi:MAG: DUF4350 domain-containing protein [Chloroflexota bacterium]